MASVAIIGADGAGKSTICQAVIARSKLPLRYVYMGVNLEASSSMLPTTRLVLWLKQRRGLRPDATFRSASSSGNAPRGLWPTLRSLLRLAYWLSEEWYRQLVVWLYELRGYIVVFDRHFYADYFAYDIKPQGTGRRPLASRLHGFMLARLYPKPSLFVLLDAPAEVLYARKREATLEYLRERQEQYRRMAPYVRRMEIVDATQSQEDVIVEVEQKIADLVGAGRRAESRQAGGSDSPGGGA